MEEKLGLIFEVKDANINDEGWHTLKFVCAGLNPEPRRFIAEDKSIHQCVGFDKYDGSTNYVYIIITVNQNDFNLAVSTDFASIKTKYAGYFCLEVLKKCRSFEGARISRDEYIKKCDKAFNKKTDKKDYIPISTNSNIEALYDNVRAAVIGQDLPIKELLSALYKNELLKNSSFDSDFLIRNKQNILICGPIGTGKTEVIRRIAKYQNVPMIIEDATRFTEAGYSGASVEEMLHHLYIKADKDQEKANRGIIILDEIDKLANEEQQRSSVSRGSVQQALLKLIEGGEINTMPDYRNSSNILTFNTAKITFIGLGAFVGIEKFRHGKTKLTPNEFVNFGMIPELMGRIPKIIEFNPLGEDALADILRGSTISPLKDHRAFFDKMGVDFIYSDEFIEYAAKKAAESNCGARSLKSVIDSAIDEQVFDVLAGKSKKLELKTPI